MKKAVGKLLSGKLKVTEAMMLKSIVKGRRLPDALNEVSAISATPGKTVSLKMSIEGEEIGELAGDGLIAATPTGSTAYSLAAGGPVVAPEIEAIILTPICPSGKSLPPMVIPPGKEVWIEPTRDGRDAAVLVDGKASCKLKRGERIVIAKSERKARFYAWRDFYSSLKKKLL
ncbi:MAG: NAD(+)/NADH kinase [Candidatus Hadarchaeales archaeon]